MFGKLGDMVGKLQEMKQRAEEIKRALDERTFRVKGANGEIELELTGNRRILTLAVSDNLKEGSKDKLEFEYLWLSRNL